MSVSDAEIAFLAHIEVGTYQTMKSSSFNGIDPTVIAKIASRCESLSCGKRVLSSTYVKSLGAFDALGIKAIFGAVFVSGGRLLELRLARSIDQQALNALNGLIYSETTDAVI